MKTKDQILLLRPATEDQMRIGHTDRLKRLLRLRRDHFDELNDAGLRLLDRSIFATFCDCVDIGQREEARGILNGVRLTVVIA